MGIRWRFSMGSVCPGVTSLDSRAGCQHPVSASVQLRLSRKDEKVACDGIMFQPQARRGKAFSQRTDRYMSID
jgi:hypothetical protein